jgi:hypothetical protein
MKKRSAAGIIAKTFLKSIGIILLFLTVGILSYYLTMLYYNQTEREERSTKYTHVISVNTGNESSNLIYSYNKEKKKIDAMVLELFDETTKNMHYITIPSNTQITISSATYTEILQVNQSIPQVVTMADLPEYFSGDVMYEYGIMILQEEFRADIGYFTMLSSDTFNQYFQKLKGRKKRYYPSASLLDAASACTNANAMENFIEEKWDDLVSDITLSQKQNYAEALTEVNRAYIRAYYAYGQESGDVFILNKRKNKKLVNSLWEAESYTSAQTGLGLSEDTDSKTDSSTKTPTVVNDRTIQITNGSGINGLAASYQQKLEADGYTVSGVGNYVGTTQTTTTIYAKKKKWAKALAGYFKNPTIAKADNLTNGADIEIILGTNDRLEQ